QTVWVEIVPRVAVDRLVLSPDLAAGDVVVTVGSAHATAQDRAVVEVRAADELVATASVPIGEPTRIALAGRIRAWSPEDPFLYDVRVVLGEDRVDSYVGMRSFGVGTDAFGHRRLLLNGEPYLHVGL